MVIIIRRRLNKANSQLNHIDSEAYAVPLEEEVLGLGSDVAEVEHTLVAFQLQVMDAVGQLHAETHSRGNLE